MKIISLLILGFMLSTSVVAVANDCESRFLSQSVSAPTDRLIGYIAELSELQILSTDALTGLRDALTRGEIKNPISEAQAKTSAQLSLHREGLQKFITRNDLDRAKLLAWLTEYINKKSVARVERTETQTKTEDIYTRQRFVKIQKGTFLMGSPETEEGRKNNEDLHEVTITYDYEIAAYPITQWQWAMVMGENLSWFRDRKESQEILINGKLIKMCPNNPVEMVNSLEDKNHADYRYSVFLFFEKLNILVKNDDQLIYKIILDHKPGYIYRLPTEAEWERAARAVSQTRYCYGDDECVLNEYAHYDQTGLGFLKSTQPVGQLKPNAFGLYDVHGNVWEWTKDLYQKNLGTSPQINSTGRLSGDFRVIRGGGWNDLVQYVRSAYRCSGASVYRGPNGGFRPVRIFSSQK